MVELEQLQARLRALLADATDGQVRWQPQPEGRWTMLQNLRHLVMAEFAHLWLLAGQPRWQDLGLPATMPWLRPSKFVGTDDSTLSEVFGAWSVVHSRMVVAQLRESEPALRQLSAHLRHQRQHEAEIGRLLRLHARHQRSQT
jgi:hypothetical protein